MTKITPLNNLTNLQDTSTSQTLINQNSTFITNAMQNTLSLDGSTPNQMQTSLDMNSNRILNLPAAKFPTDPLRMADVSTPIPVTGTSLALSGTLGVAGATSLTNLTTTGAVEFKAGPWNDVTAYGADPTGVADSTSAIQTAINSLPTSGGTVFFPVGNYKISSTLIIGNGTTSSVSTRMGVVLRGANNPNAPGPGFISGYPLTSGAKLTWAGGTTTSMISVNGPLQGWGINNLLLDGALTTGINGITVTSAQNGDSGNLAIINCFHGIVSTSNPLGGYSGVGNVDSLHNNWTNLNVLVPGVTSAAGIFLSGASDGSSDTDYNTFVNTFIRFAATSASNFGLYLGVCDSNSFFNINIGGQGGSGSKAVILDYTIATGSNFPLGNTIFGADFGAGGLVFTNNGSPSVNSRPNYIYGLQESNGGINPNIQGWYSSLPVVTPPTIALTGQTAALTSTSTGYQVPNTAGLYRISYYLVVTAAATAGTITPNILWNDGQVVQTFAGAAVNATGKNYTQGVLTAFIEATGNVTYQTVFTGITGSPQYSFYITVEKIQ